MSIEENKAIVGRWFTEFWGKDFNPAVIDELAAPRPPGRARTGTRRVLHRQAAQLRPAAGLAAGRRVPARRAEPPARDRVRAHRQLRRSR